MKTVKFSLNELMSEIDESFIEEVYFHDCNKILKKYSKQKIRQNVFCKTASKHKPLKFTYRTAIIVTVVSVFLCMPVYAAISHLLTSALIDDSNRHLIGTETNDRSYIILKDGVYTNENGKVVDIEELAKSSSEFPESRIVKSSLMPNFIPSSIVEIPTDKSDEMYIIPEIILINNSLCVLTQDNGKEIESGLQPQGFVFKCYFAKRTSHIVDAYKPINAERRREDVGEVLPERRNGSSRPGYSRNEQQGNGGEYENQHTRLPVADSNGSGHGKEDTGRQIGQHEQCQGTGLPDLIQTEYARNYAEYIY